MKASDELKELTPTELLNEYVKNTAGMVGKPLTNESVTSLTRVTFELLSRMRTLDVYHFMTDTPNSLASATVYATSEREARKLLEDTYGPDTQYTCLVEYVEFKPIRRYGDPHVVCATPDYD